MHRSRAFYKSTNEDVNDSDNSFDDDCETDHRSHQAEGEKP